MFATLNIPIAAAEATVNVERIPEGIVVGQREMTISFGAQSMLTEIENRPSRVPFEIRRVRTIESGDHG